MPILPVHNEGSTCWIQVSFAGRDGLPATPVTVEYRIDCLTGEEMVLTWTEVEADSEVEIEITSAQNDILDSGNNHENRLVTVKATYGDGDYDYEEYEYILKKLRKADMVSPG
jgi:hypothetical protein